MSETSSSEWDRSLGFLKQCSMGIRLMIIELRNTMKAENYLYEIEPQGRSTGKLSGRGPGASMTRAAVRMEEGRQGCEQGTGAHTNGVESGMGIEVREVTAEQSKKH